MVSFRSYLRLPGRFDSFCGAGDEERRPKLTERAAPVCHTWKSSWNKREEEEEEEEVREATEQGERVGVRE